MIDKTILHPRHYRHLIDTGDGCFRVFCLPQPENSMMLHGNLGQCYLLHHFANGTTEDLRGEDKKPPTAFSVEAWKRMDESGHHWLLEWLIHFGGVRWQGTKCTGGCSCCCTGEAVFEYTNAAVEERRDREAVFPAEEKHVLLDFAELIRKHQRDIEQSFPEKT